MAIYDREYVFNRPQRGTNYTLALIVACCAVFVTQIFLEAGPKWGWPVYINDILYQGADLNGAKPVGPYVDAAGKAANQHALGETVLRELRNPSNVQVGARRYLVRDPIFAFGHFSTYTAIFRLEVWRLISFQFLHGSLMHLAFNMLGLWIFGRTVEAHLGGKRYLSFYLMCGIAGGLLYLLLNLIGFFVTGSLPGLLVHHPAVPLIGASAGVFGVIMAAAKIMPEVEILVFGIVPMKMRQFAYGYVILALIMLLMGAKNAGGEAAHLGGAMAGFYFIRNSHLLRDFFDILGRKGKGLRPRGSQPKLTLTVPEPSTKTKVGKDKAGAQQREQMPEDLRKAMDDALAKQLRDGPNSLTPEELDSLQRATAWLKRNQ